MPYPEESPTPERARPRTGVDILWSYAGQPCGFCHSHQEEFKAFDPEHPDPAVWELLTFWFRRGLLRNHLQVLDLFDRATGDLGIPWEDPPPQPGRMDIGVWWALFPFGGEPPAQEIVLHAPKVMGDQLVAAVWGAEQGRPYQALPVCKILRDLWGRR
jgi:hypothetical protein